MSTTFTTLEQLSDATRNAPLIIFSDAEYLNETLGLRQRPGPDHWKEVIQIGAVKYKYGKKVGEFNRLVKPAVFGEKNTDDQWTFFEESFTRLSRKEIMAKGEDFEVVWKDFLGFTEGGPIVIMLGDREVYKWNFRLLEKNMDNVIDAMPWTILKPMLPDHLKRYVSGELYQIVGLKSEEVNPMAIHDALFDATSMALFMEHYEKSI